MIKDTDKKKEAMTRIEMRISKEDKAIIEQKARKTGLTTSEFVRRSALGRRLPCYGDTTLLQEYSMQLGKSTGLHADEVIHIGDSLSSDVKGASSVGIKAIWLNRFGKKNSSDVDCITNLLEALDKCR